MSYLLHFICDYCWIVLICLTRYLAKIMKWLLLFYNLFRNCWHFYWICCLSETLILRFCQKLINLALDLTKLILQSLVMSLVLLLHNSELYIFIIQFPVLFLQVHVNRLKIRPISSLQYRLVIDFAIFSRSIQQGLAHLLILYWKIIIL